MKRMMMMATMALLVLVLFSGCMTYFGSESGKLSYAEVVGDSVGEVNIEKGFLFVLHPDIFVSGGKTWENIDQDIEPVLNELGGDAVRNLELGYGATLIDMVLSSVVPVVSWGTYTITGEAVDQ